MARITYPFLKAFNTDLQPLSGGLAYTYEPGGTTHQTTYADPALKTKNKNPVALNPAGETPSFFSKGAEVKIVVKNADGGSIWTAEVSNRPMDAAPTADMATFQAYGHNGAALAGGRVYTYKAGTTTPETTYSDAALLVENDNPVVLDANGQADIFRAKGFEGLKLILKDSVDRLLWSWQYFGFNDLYAAQKQSLNLQLFTPADIGVVSLPLTLIDTNYQGSSEYW